MQGIQKFLKKLKLYEEFICEILEELAVRIKDMCSVLKGIWVFDCSRREKNYIKC